MGIKSIDPKRLFSAFGLSPLLLYVGHWVKHCPNCKKNQTWVLKAYVFVFASLLWAAVMWVGAQKGDGVILDAEVTARKGNGLIFAPAFTHPLHEGTEVLKLEERSGWVYVQLSNGQNCWLPEQSVAWVKN